MSFLQDVKAFSQKSLRRVDTKVTTTGGQKFVEKRLESGKFTLSDTGERCLGFCGDYKPDLQVVDVRPWLLLSSQDVAAELPLLRQHKVTHILNVASLVDNHFENEFKYLKLNILDLPETDITSYFDQCFQFIDGAKTSGGVALIHCNAGVSRSVSIIVAYLMTTEKIPMEESMRQLKQVRPAVGPNQGFKQQLQQYEKQVLQ
ncbi:dual specificity protein phosphatase 19-like [Ptychodera flava]|uniref:dual specificity protein phosphatase 19-like n=1 Tax=Ptychodera flava TaxID=63121 RepID=UPI00396A8290